MNIENVTMFAGEDRMLTFHGRDSSNNPVSLTGKTVTWYLGYDPLYRAQPTSLFTKTGVVTVAASGTFTVELDAADTVNMAGDYEHMAKATSGAGDVAIIVAGRFRVQPVVSPT